MGTVRRVLHPTFGGKHLEWFRPIGGWWRHLHWRRMCVPTSERGLHCGADPCWYHLVAFDEEHEIDEVLDATVRGSISWKRVRVELLSPMLLRRKGRNSNRGNACEAEPIISNELVQRLKNLVANTKLS